MTPAAIRVVDVPGTGAQLLGNLRQVDALLAVVDGYSDDADPAGDLETLKLELLVADTDHVAQRLRARREGGEVGRSRRSGRRPSSSSGSSRTWRRARRWPSGRVSCRPSWSR